jgi:hypothetical protein
LTPRARIQEDSNHDVEERFEFLFQSIAAHDRQIGELVENGAKLDARIEAMAAVTQSNFDRLTLAMTGLTEHADDHGQRIRKLEA